LLKANSQQPTVIFIEELFILVKLPVFLTPPSKSNYELSDEVMKWWSDESDEVIGKEEAIYELRITKIFLNLSAYAVPGH